MLVLERAIKKEKCYQLFLQSFWSPVLPHGGEEPIVSSVFEQLFPTQESNG